MAVRVIYNNVPERPSRGRKAIEAAVRGGLEVQNHTDCTVSIFEDPEHFEITVKIECVEGFWSRKLSPNNSTEELEPEFIQRAVAEINFIKQS